MFIDRYFPPSLLLLEGNFVGIETPWNDSHNNIGPLELVVKEVFYHDFYHD